MTIILLGLLVAALILAAISVIDSPRNVLAWAVLILAVVIVLRVWP